MSEPYDFEYPYGPPVVCNRCGAAVQRRDLHDQWHAEGVMGPPSPSRRVVDYPVCGDWSCDDDCHWEAVGDEASPEFYSAVKREEQIVRRHEPRSQWPHRLQEERDKRNEGRPLWSGKR